MASPYNQKLGDPTQAARFDEGKPRLELVPAALLEAAARGFGYGADKYDPWNWAKGFPNLQPFASLMRHLWAWHDGEDIDQESGLHHLDLAACNIAMMVHFQKHGIGEDIRCHAVLKQSRENHGSEEKSVETEDIPEETTCGYWVGTDVWACDCFGKYYGPGVSRCHVCGLHRPNWSPAEPTGFPCWDGPEEWICSCYRGYRNWPSEDSCYFCGDHRPAGRPEDSADGGIPGEVAGHRDADAAGKDV